MVLGLIGSLIGTILGRGYDAFDITNGVFNSVVAVTGDAHQAQVAQDIFRQEVRIERSLRIREDIRDAHRLMIENVQTQLLMGNIVLGVCFAVLVEGKPSNPERAPVVVQELWAVFSVWSISLSVLSVWFALSFQESVSISARKRLLEKHRICMPNDEIVGRMGGLSLAQKVAQLHQRGLDEVQKVLVQGGGVEPREVARLLKNLPSHLGILGVRPQGGGGGAGSSSLVEGASAEDEGSVTDEEPSPPSPLRASLPAWGSPWGARVGSLRSPNPVVQTPDLHGAMELLAPHLRVEEVHFSSSHKRAQPLSDISTVRARRGTHAWFDDNGLLSTESIVDLPDFLVDETLIRCSWTLPQKEKIQMKVQGKATLYVAAQWPPLGSQDAFCGVGPPPNWSEEELPEVRCRTEPDVAWSSAEILQCGRVEGFSIYVSKERMELPIYRVALVDPQRDGFVEMKLKFRFGGEFQAPVIVLRRGRVVTSEEDWPVREFWDEVQSMQPLRDHSMRYMSHGLMSLLLAAFFGHLGRVLPDRPWPLCRREIVLLVGALIPALIFTCGTDELMKKIFGTQSYQETRDLLERSPDLDEGLQDVCNVEGSMDTGSSRQTASGVSSRDVLSAARSRSSSPLECAAPSGAMTSQPCAAPTARGGLGECCSPPRYMGTSAEDQEGLSVFSCGGGALPAADHTDRQDARSRAFAEEGQEARILDYDARAERSNRDAASVLDPEGVVEAATNHRRRRLLVSGSAACSSADKGTTQDRHECKQGTGGSLQWRASVASLDSTDNELVDPPRRQWWKLCPRPKPINVLSALVYIVWFISIAWIVAAWLLELHGGKFTDAESHWECALGEMWTVQSVSWPSPFFTPSVAVFGRDERLWVASDWLLVRVLDGDPGAAVDNTVGLPLHLPAVVRGLLLPSNHSGSSGRLLAATDRILYAFDPADASRRPTTLLAVGGLSGIVGATLTSSVVDTVAKLPWTEFGPMAAVASAALPVSPGLGTADVVAFAPVSGGVYLSIATNLLELGTHDLAVAARVPFEHHSEAINVTALHLCTEGGCGAGQPVLWAADRLGCLSAIGLEAGEVLGTWRWSRLAAAGQQQAVAFDPVALAGNATHLVVVARCAPVGAPAVFSATYEELLATRLFSPSCGSS